MGQFAPIEQSPWPADIWQEYKIPIILGSISLICIAISLVLFFKSYRSIEPIRFSSDVTEATVAGAVSGVMVDVAGAVVHPGVYMIQVRGRVEDAIVSAGGLAKNADASWVAKHINRAMTVSDGMKIYIPMIGDQEGNSETSHNSECITSTGDVAQSCGIVTASTGRSQNAAPVSINFASQSELESLPGVGPVTAKKIINNRPYASVDELISKKAIGQSLFAKLKDQLAL